MDFLATKIRSLILGFSFIKEVIVNRLGLGNPNLFITKQSIRLHDSQKTPLNIEKLDFHGEWNYKIKPYKLSKCTS